MIISVLLLFYHQIKLYELEQEGCWFQFHTVSPISTDALSCSKPWDTFWIAAYITYFPFTYIKYTYLNAEKNRFVSRQMFFSCLLKFILVQYTIYNLINQLSVRIKKTFYKKIK